MIEVRTHDELPEGSDRAAWQLLVDEDPAATLFHTPRYLAAWAEVFGGSTAVRVHTIHRDGRLIGVIPDANDVQGGPAGPEEIRRFQGGTEVTDYLGPVSRPEDRFDVATAYVGNLATDVDWDEFVAGGLADDSGWPEAFRRAIAAHDLEVIEDGREDVCPRVSLPGDHDAFLASLPGRLRQELNRKTRKLARDAGELELIEVPGEEVAGRLDAFLDQAALSFPDKAGFFQRADMHTWFRVLAERFVPDGTFRLHELHVGGLLASSTVSLVHRGTWGLYNSAFDPTLAALAPGVVHINLLIGAAADQGYRVFDLLRGDEAYKYRYGATDRELTRLVVRRS
ncbi:MAG: GNAT family N-acetyltransferase [Nitriliruptoraceae bacterium]